MAGDRGRLWPIRGCWPGWVRAGHYVTTKQNTPAENKLVNLTGLGHYGLELYFLTALEYWRVRDNFSVNLDPN